MENNGQEKPLTATAEAYLKGHRNGEAAMRHYARNAALEEAAKVCDPDEEVVPYGSDAYLMARCCAAAVRALKT